MKKLVILLSFLVFAVATMAQNTYIVTPKTFTGWGTTADTLTASVVKSYTIEVKATQVMVMNLVLRTDSVSGTGAYTALLMRSMDGVNWLNVDTISLTGGASKYAEFDPVNTYFKYYKVQVTATSAAQKQRMYLYVTARRN